MVLLKIEPQMIDFVDMAIQVERAREGQSSVFENIASELW
jgi:hypothetical protein